MTETPRTTPDIRRDTADQRRAAAALTKAYNEAAAERPNVVLNGGDEALVALDAEIGRLGRGLERSEAKLSGLEIELVAARAREALEAIEARRERLLELTDRNRDLHDRYGEIAGEMAAVLREMQVVAEQAAKLNAVLAVRQHVDIEAFRRGAPSSYTCKPITEAVVLPGAAEDDPAIWPAPASPRSLAPIRVSAEVAPMETPIANRATFAATDGVQITRDDAGWWAEREEAERQERIAASTSRSTARAAFGSAVEAVR